MTSSDESIPDFSKHIPQLLQAYAHAWKENGPGLLSVAFESKSGKCDVSYHKEDSIPDKIKIDMLTFQNKYSSDVGISFIMFHDVDIPFSQGQLRCFSTESTEKNNK